jgi:hypothetical protein
MSGGVIGKPNFPTLTTASGIWRPSNIVRELKWPGIKDQYFSSVTFLSHFDTLDYPYTGIKNAGTGTDPTLVSTSFVTAASTFQTTVGYVNGAANSRINVTSNAGYDFGTGDFTIETWVKFPSIPGSKNFWDFRSGGTSVSPNVAIWSDGSIRYFGQASSGVGITGTAGRCSDAGWHHIAISKISSVTKMFIDGTQEGSNYTDTYNYTSNGFAIGNGNNQAGIGDSGCACYVAGTRITKGVGRYSTTFTPSQRYSFY